MKSTVPEHSQKEKKERIKGIQKTITDVTVYGLTDNSKWIRFQKHSRNLLRGSRRRMSAKSRGATSTTRLRGLRNERPSRRIGHRSEMERGKE